MALLIVLHLENISNSILLVLENTDDLSENGKNHPFELISTERDIKFIIHNHISICLIIAQNTKK